MRKIRLNTEEKKIVEAIDRGEYVPVGGKELHAVADSIAARRKNITLTIRVNSQDISRIKKFSLSKGTPYQTYLSEVIPRVATTV